MGISYYSKAKVEEINGNVPGDFVSGTTIMKDPAYLLTFTWWKNCFKPNATINPPVFSNLLTMHAIASEELLHALSNGWFNQKYENAMEDVSLESWHHGRRIYNKKAWLEKGYDSMNHV